VAEKELGRTLPDAADPSGTGPARVAGQAARPARWEGFAAWLFLTSPLVLLLAVIGAVAAYLILPSKPGSSPVVPEDPASALLIGFLVSGAAWLLSAILLRSLTSAPNAQPRLYLELCERYDQLRDRLPAGEAGPADAVKEARDQLDYAERALRGDESVPGLRWALGHGYISVYRAIHRAEEALLLTEAPETLVGEAIHDELVLDRSTIANREYLQGMIRTAIGPASEDAARSLLPPLPGRAQATDDRLTAAAAREVLRAVRLAVNVVRDGARDGLIRTRGRLLWAMLAVAALTYLLVGLAIFRGVSSNYVSAAAAFYLVGAIVGLFNRLRIEAGRSSATDDYGLSQGRLLASVLVSGLAAVGGVYLIAVLPSLLPAGTSAHPASLEAVFDLPTNQIGLVYAALFGLAPGLAPKLLYQEADRLEGDLLASQPATTVDGATTDGGR
jgi:hypothetical protein